LRLRGSPQKLPVERKKTRFVAWCLGGAVKSENKPKSFQNKIKTQKKKKRKKKTT
jgi:hypothetical protein